ncbi:MAG: hypothetical protein DRI93_00830 [Aquificota bacterium]|nr:MAG: hypothetical protein DRI93_00830 [Aquificota bacterium]RLD97370.1 MAG: hypothetical protein DRI91_05340 [Aquificota bacterium]
MIYVETSLVLVALRNDERGEEARGYLEKVWEAGGHLSELVLAEIHNLDEPRREWTARLLKDVPLPILRVNLQSLELANRYVYNKVFDQPLRDLGFHAALASVRRCERLDTCDGRLLEAVQGIDRVNQVAGYTTPGFSFPLSNGPWEGDEELDGVRTLSWRVTSRRKSEEVVRTVQEMADNFVREKGLSLEKVGKIEIF